MTDDKVPEKAEKGPLACDDPKDQFMRTWPLVSNWIFHNFEAAILKQRRRRLLMKYWSMYVEAARVLPPPLLSSSSNEEA